MYNNVKNREIKIVEKRTVGDIVFCESLEKWCLNQNN